MPWRGDPDPYAVWVSEIMLQQTRVETVRGYFARFLRAFPDVRALATAPQEAVLKQWEGLGYYARARNLQAAARQLAAPGRVLPKTSAAWAALPGVGPYTAAAIASISFGEPAPVVDGNVARVLSRLRLLPDDFRKPGPRQALADWLRPAIASADSPGDFNQALMDLGETICHPRDPACAECPLARRCLARRASRQAEFPARTPRKPLPVRRVTALLVRGPGGRVLLAKRVATPLLKGLWELPEASTLAAPRTRRLGVIEHAFSHFRQTVTVLQAEGPVPVLESPALRFARPEELPLTTVARRALELKP